MLRLTLTTFFTLALLLCGSAARMAAQGDTKITVKDGGSILLRADGLDSGAKWKVFHNELRHLRPTGVLSALQVTEAGADRCGGDPKCAIDPSQPWTIQVNYGASSVTIASISANNGLHVKFSRHMPFSQWQKTGNPDERGFGHGDGLHITGIAVNNGPNLCAGKDGCEIDLTYTAQ